MVAHLEHVGYSGADAMHWITCVFGFAAIRKIVMGLPTTRPTARRAAIDFAIQAGAIALGFAIENAIAALVFAAVYGLTVAPPMTLLPLLSAESLGTASQMRSGRVVIQPEIWREQPVTARSACSPCTSCRTVSSTSTP